MSTDARREEEDGEIHLRRDYIVFPESHEGVKRDGSSNKGSSRQFSERAIYLPFGRTFSSAGKRRAKQRDINGGFKTNGSRRKCEPTELMLHFPRIMRLFLRLIIGAISWSVINAPDA